MKKSELVKFRVDIDTYAALVRHCQQTGGNLSQVLRGFILRELEEQRDSGSAAGVLEARSNSDLDAQERNACAKVLATLLLGQGVPSSSQSRAGSPGPEGAVRLPDCSRRYSRNWHRLPPRVQL